jgi:hypothetical protein
MTANRVLTVLLIVLAALAILWLLGVRVDFR